MMVEKSFMLVYDGLLQQKWQMLLGGVKKRFGVGPRIYYPYLFATQLKDRKLQVEEKYRQTVGVVWSYGLLHEIV